MAVGPRRLVHPPVDDRHRIGVAGGGDLAIGGGGRPRREVADAARTDRVPQVVVAAMFTHAAHVAGTGVAQAHDGSPVQFAVATLVFSRQGDGCISVTPVRLRLIAWKRADRDSV